MGESTKIWYRWLFGRSRSSARTFRIELSPLRALKVLGILSASSMPLPVASVAREIAADRSTAYRMLLTLMEAGYVERDATTRCFENPSHSAALHASGSGTAPASMRRLCGRGVKMEIVKLSLTD